MRGADHDIGRAGVFAHDHRHGLDHVLDALVWREQAKGENHRPVDAQLGSEVRAGRSLDVGDAVGDEVDLVGRQIVDLDQEANRLLTHHHHALGQLQQFVQHLLLRGRRLAQHRVERGDNRHLRLTYEAHQIAARNPAVDAVLMLNGEHVVPGAVHEIGGNDVSGGVAIGDLESNLLGVDVTLTIAHGDHVDGQAWIKVGQRSREVCAKRGNSTLSGQIATKQNDIANWFSGEGQRIKSNYRSLYPSGAPRGPGGAPLSEYFGHEIVARPL